jgi:hypothetical protein
MKVQWQVSVGLLKAASALDNGSHSIICVRQEHPFSSTVADFLISDQIRQCTQSAANRLVLLDFPSHPITRRVALSQGFQSTDKPNELAKIALGYPVTDKAWRKAQLAVERLSRLKLPEKCPRYNNGTVKVVMPGNKSIQIALFDLETLLSPTLFAFSKRKAVVVPINREFAAHLLGTDDQLTFLEVPEAEFLSRRTYFNTTRAANAMIRGAIIAFYESKKRGGRGAIVALGRIVDVTSVAVASVPEAIKRGAVVDDLALLTGQHRILATTFDNLVALKKPVPLQRLREIGCVTRANFVSATPISTAHIKTIVEAGNRDD